MLKLSAQLLRLRQDYPALSQDLPPVVKFIQDIEDSQPMRRQARSLNSLVGGTTIFGVKESVARTIERELRLYKLKPYTATISFKNREAILLVATTQEKGSEPLNDFSCQYIAAEIADTLSTGMGYDLKATGSFSTFLDAPMFRFVNKV